jgi:hypothetical protein
MGPFEMWDAVGPERSAALMEAHGYKIPLWVKRMLKRVLKPSTPLIMVKGIIMILQQAITGKMPKKD